MMLPLSCLSISDTEMNNLLARKTLKILLVKGLLAKLAISADGMIERELPGVSNVIGEGIVIAVCLHGENNFLGKYTSSFCKNIKYLCFTF